jgi:hypothetical protein
MEIEDADSVRWGIWSHGAKTREANTRQGDTIRCEVAGIALRNRQPACRNLIEDGFCQFDEIHLYNLNDWSTMFRRVRT